MGQGGKLHLVSEERLRKRCPSQAHTMARRHSRAPFPAPAVDGPRVVSRHHLDSIIPFPSWAFRRVFIEKQVCPILFHLALSLRSCPLKRFKRGVRGEVVVCGPYLFLSRPAHSSSIPYSSPIRNVQEGTLRVSRPGTHILAHTHPLLPSHTSFATPLAG